MTPHLDDHDGIVTAVEAYQTGSTIATPRGSREPLGTAAVRPGVSRLWS
jgi:hypothetical protein